MSRVGAVDPSSANPQAKPLLDAVNAAFGVTPNLFRVAAQSPAALEGLLGLSGALAKGALDARTRAAIALAVAEANASNYCLSAHSALGREAGLTDPEIASARNGLSDDPKIAESLRFARTLVETRGVVSDSELSRLRAAGVGEGEIVGNIVVNIYTNYLNAVAGTEIDFPAVKVGVARAA